MAGRNAMITLLPDEMIEHILADKNIDVQDVIKFGLTCKRFYKIINSSNEFWQTKFFQRYPYLKEHYTKCLIAKRNGLYWLQETQTFMNIRHKLLYELSLMSKNNYNKRELSASDLKGFDPLFRPEEGAHPVAYYFLVQELISIIKHPAKYNNLTYSYYAPKVVRYLKQNYLEKEWQRFKNLPPKEHILEYGATLVSQWSQPEKNISYADISTTLDKLAKEVIDLLRVKHPTHPLLSVSEEQLSHWRKNNIDDNQWSLLDNTRVITEIRRVLFITNRFRGDNYMYYDLNNSYIDQVLRNKHGIPITLAIVFESVARRVGIKCEAISFPSHFLLRWKEKYITTEPEEVKHFYIDVFNGGHFLTKKDCPKIAGVSRCPIEMYNNYGAASVVEVVARMANNLQVAARQLTNFHAKIAKLRSALELRHMVQPDDTNVISQLTRFYIHQGIDVTELTKVLQNMQNNSEASRILQDVQLLPQTLNIYDPFPSREEVRIKERTRNVKYAIGLIMVHNLHGYTSVIAGWDTEPVFDEEWKTEADCDLEYDDDQPFYNLLVNDGSSRYVPQERLRVAEEPEWINHEEIGRYFCKFNETHYIPNEGKAMEYPEDAKIRDIYMHNIYDK